MKEYKYKINGNQYNVVVNDFEDNVATVEVNGTPYKVEMENSVKAAPKKTTITRPSAAPATPKREAPVAKPQPSAGGGSKSGVKSPLPGVILDIKVNVGDVVKKGQTVVMLEAMKMENNINATKDGKVTEIKVNKGDSVLEGTDLVIIE